MKSNKTTSWKEDLYRVIYEADTKEGKCFDIILIIAILASILLVMLESVEIIDKKYHKLLDISEWVITIFFSMEYVARVISVKKPSQYIFSFYGIIDFLALIPKYLSLFIVGTHALVTLRALRLLRIFRILKLPRYIGASKSLIRALKNSKTRITVFLMSISILTVILGTIMYLVEGPESGFTSIPNSMYWSVVTLTTVGYGDISPETPLGKLIASVIMILGYAIIAVPTGIVTSEITKHESETENLRSKKCENCKASKHPEGAKYCFECGKKIGE